MEKTFSRDLQSLGDIKGFVAEFFDASGISECNDYYVNLVIEELFTNAAKYSPNGGSLTLALSKENGELIIRLWDRDVEPFDPTQVPEVDTNGPLKDRRRGGLGIHLVRRLSREISYQYVDRSSVTTVKMVLEA